MRTPILLGIAFASVLAVSADARAAVCTPTGFMRDSVNLTAALINPSSVVTGLIDATGCNIGVYYDGGNDARVNGADVYGASYFGIMVNSDNGGTSRVNIRHTKVHHIGDVPHSGGQYGIGIYLRAYAGFINGVVDNNQVFDYQKGGISVNGSGSNVEIVNNIVVGDGHVAFIAQNGIQVGFGASSEGVTGNYVVGNSYVGNPGDGSSAGGILIAGGPGLGTCAPIAAPCDYTKGIPIHDNTLFANDVGVFLFNVADASHSSAPVETNVVVSRNTVYGDLCYNKVYQAGVSDLGNSDDILHNSITGPGYIQCVSGTQIDVIDAINPTVRRFVGPSSQPHPQMYVD